MVIILMMILGLEVMKIAGEDTTRTVTSYSSATVTYQYRDHNNSVFLNQDILSGRYAIGAPSLSFAGHLSLEVGYACHEAPTPESSPTEPVVVLVKRGNCSFDDKVNNVKDMKNIQGIIIYNDRQESGLRTIYVSNASIPIVFISLEDGDILAEMIQTGAGLEVIVSKESFCQHLSSGITKCVHYVLSDVSETDFSEERRTVNQWDIVCISVALFLVASFSLVSFLFYWLRKLRRVHKLDQMEAELELMAREAVAMMELTRLDTDSEEDCSVCLEIMVTGVEVRSLPCGHVFHRKCIDKWLIRKRKCPLCKLDILQHYRNQLSSSVTSE